MITRLEIRNYAIIEELILDFSENLNILTGETGSGKSIILGAFGLIMGRRADSKVLLNKSEKCIVEACFDISSYALETFFQEENLDYDEQAIVRREINSAGKSRAFINDTPVKLKQLQHLATQLVDLHQQFENQGINDVNEQIKMLDSFAGANTLQTEYRGLYQQLKQLENQQERLQMEHRNALKQRDFVSFQLAELQELDLDLDKDHNLEQYLDQMDHAQDIMTGMGELSYAIQQDDQSILTTLGAVQQRVQDLGKFHQGVQEIYDRLESVKIELADIADEAMRISEGLEIDEERLHRTRERLDQINAILHKHQLSELTAIAQLRSDFEQELSGYSNLERELEETRSEITHTRGQASAVAIKLSKKRREAKPHFEKGVNRLLQELKMEYANFRIEIASQADLLPSGQDRIGFLFAPNKGSEHRAIKEVASGGELSRLSLIAKSLVAGSVNLPTLLFDEIDSGVSGDVAQKMGQILQDLAQKHQVISITHSPQVAARADRHFKVFKTMEKNTTKAQIQTLSEEDRMVEIATMLSSSPPSSIALESARELMQSR